MTSKRSAMPTIEADFQLWATVAVIVVAFAVAVVFAANCSIASPIGNQTNLLVMTPGGGHRFADFVRVGSPLIVLLWITFSLFAPWYFGLW